MFQCKTDSPTIKTLPPLSDQDKSKIKNLAEMYDQSKKGGLEFDEFLGFMKAVTGLSNCNDIEGEVPESGRVNIVYLKFLYDGMDLEGKNNVPINDVCTCVTAINEKDYKWMAKMVFRGCDYERHRKIKSEDIQNAIQNVNKNDGNNAFSTEDFNERCKKVFGQTKKTLEYWEFYKLVTGENIDPSTDPYDGCLKEKSKCCLLL